MFALNGHGGGKNAFKNAGRDLMIPTPPKPKYAKGTRLRVTQHVRVGGRSWNVQFEGFVELEGLRPVGGMEMGGKASYCFQPTIRLRRDDGEVMVVALDEESQIQEVAPGAGGV